MERVLAESLLQKNLIGVGTEVNAVRNSQAFGDYSFEETGDYLIQDVRKNRYGEPRFFLDNTRGGRYWAEPGSIRLIEGMKPVDFAQAYRLDERGQPLGLGRKRGRKTKNELIALMLVKMLDEGRITRRETVCVVNRDEDDDGSTMEEAYITEVILDEEPPCVEMKSVHSDEEPFLVDATQINRIGLETTAEMLEEFREHRRNLRNVKEFNGRNHQLRRHTFSPIEGAAL